MKGTAAAAAGSARGRAPAAAATARPAATAGPRRSRSPRRTAACQPRAPAVSAVSSGFAEAAPCQRAFPTALPGTATPDRSDGSSAARELFDLVIAGSSGLDFCDRWESSSGADAGGALFSEHRLLCHTFWLLCAVSTAPAAEHVARRIFQIRCAVQVDPRCPRFDGLHEHMMHLGDPVLGGSIRWMDRAPTRTRPAMPGAWAGGPAAGPRRVSEPCTLQQGLGGTMPGAWAGGPTVEEVN
jgi:hypothetical protein